MSGWHGYFGDAGGPSEPVKFTKPVDNTEFPKTVDWTQEKFMRFKRHYANALEGNKAQFMFEGHGFLTGYAKYLIEFLEGKFK